MFLYTACSPLYTVACERIADKPLPVYGEGLNVRDWLYVEDHCRVIDLIIHKGRVGEVYNVGGHNEMKNIDIVKIICKELGKPESLITHVTDRKGHDMRYAIDPTKIHNELGWIPETKFEDGIKKTIQWYLDNKEWWETTISGEYQDYYEKMYGERQLITEALNILNKYNGVVSAFAAVVALFVTVMIYKQTLVRECKLDTIRTLSELRIKYPSVREMSDGDKLSYLQELEFFSTGINKKIYDIKTVKAMSGSRLISQYNKYLKKFIEERRKGKESTAYIEYEKMIKQLENE